MYRLIVETLLGLRLEADQLRVSPRLPHAWESFKLHYRYRETFYHITVKRAGGKFPSGPSDRGWRGTTRCRHPSR